MLIATTAAPLANKIPAPSSGLLLRKMAIAVVPSHAKSIRWGFAIGPFNASKPTHNHETSSCSRLMDGPAVNGTTNGSPSKTAQMGTLDLELWRYAKVVVFRQNDLLEGLRRPLSLKTSRMPWAATRNYIADPVNPHTSRMNPGFSEVSDPPLNLVQAVLSIRREVSTWPVWLWHRSVALLNRQNDSLLRSIRFNWNLTLNLYFGKKAIAVVPSRVKSTRRGLRLPPRNASTLCTSTRRTDKTMAGAINSIQSESEFKPLLIFVLRKMPAELVWRAFFRNRLWFTKSENLFI